MAERTRVEVWAAISATFIVTKTLGWPALLSEEGYTEAEITEMVARCYLLSCVNFALGRDWNAEQAASYLEEFARRLRSGEAFAAAEKIKDQLAQMAGEEVR